MTIYFGEIPKSPQQKVKVFVSKNISYFIDE